MSASKPRPPYAGNLPLTPTAGRTYTAPRTDGVVGRAVGPAGRLPAPPDAPAMASGGLTHNEAHLLDLWLCGRSDADVSAELGLPVEQVRELKRRLLGRLGVLKLDDPTPAG
jgi:DNA-binding CsgD family transcriptional regulator